MSPAPNQLRRRPPRPNPKPAKPGPNPCQPNPRLIQPPRYVGPILRYDTLLRYNGRYVASRWSWQHRDSKATPRVPPPPGPLQRALHLLAPFTAECVVIRRLFAPLVPGPLLTPPAPPPPLDF